METVDVRAGILFIDFEGRSDGESIRKIISQIKPRQLVCLFVCITIHYNLVIFTKFTVFFIDNDSNCCNLLY